ncbi:MAG: hypothetical protein ACP5QT_09270 [Brevinematia bacterium]
MPLMLLRFFHPYNALIILLSFYLLIFSISLIFFNKRQFFIFIPALIILLLVFHLSVLKLNLLEYSQYKGIATALRLPEAKFINRKITPYVIIEVIEAKGLRRVNGLSYNFKGDIPPQRVIYIDGNQSGIILKSTNSSDLEYLNWCSQALPYSILKRKTSQKLLIPGAGGNEGIYRGILSGFEKIVVVDENKELVNIFRKEAALNQKNVEILNLEIRNFLKTTRDKFDIIEINLYDSSTSSTIQSLSENYLYTIEGLYDAYNTLSCDGILSITRWAISPANDAIKLFATAIEMFEKYKINNYREKIAFIRSANTVTLCLSKSSISIEDVRKFCKKMYFDILYCNGTGKVKYFKQKEGISREIIENILSDKRKEFIKDYPFNISPPSDNRPFYYNFFKIKTLKLIMTQSRYILPFYEWGYGILLILLTFVIPVSLILVLVPVVRIKSHTLELKNYYAYFFLIGIAYFFVELPLIHKLTLYLAYPVYSFSIVLTSLLFFSGLGSYFSGRMKPQQKKLIFIIPLTIILSNLAVDLLSHHFPNLSLWQRFLITLIITGFPAFFMGFPFPSTIEILKQKKMEEIIPVVWTINGFASVLSSLLASIFSMSFGFSLVLHISAAIYVISGFIFINFN